MTKSYKQAALEKRRAALMEDYHAVIEQISMAIDPVTLMRLERRMESLEGLISSLDAELLALQQAPEGQSDTETDAVSLYKLRDNLVEFFSSGDLQELCFNLNIEYDDLRGESRKEKILDLISYSERHNRLHNLKDEISRLRPHATW